MMLIYVKAGTEISGHKFMGEGNYIVADEFARSLYVQGLATVPRFDEANCCDMPSGYTAIRQLDGISILSGGDPVISGIPAEFPLQHLPSILAAYGTGEMHGNRSGRVKLQSELRALLNAEAAGAVIQ